MDLYFGPFFFLGIFCTNCFAVNIDGTGHDGYHNVKLKSEVADFLRSMGVNIKASNIIETRIISSKQLLFD